MPEETNCRFAVDQTSLIDKAGPVSFDWRMVATSPCSISSYYEVCFSKLMCKSMAKSEYASGQQSDTRIPKTYHM